ncbi:7SK snRNA methylphosphate capping enzyme-like [Watersipora subatra]|uniref:7SK snRNA methylphosphate capping enzyme-like n=1 Tax=Watersipora subatra TaxID=2589382 RepID=UPI00355BAD73
MVDKETDMSVEIKPSACNNQDESSFDTQSSAVIGSTVLPSSDCKKRRQSQHLDGEDQPYKKRRFSASRQHRQVNHIKLYKGGSLSDPLNLSGLQNRTGPSPSPSPDAYLERLNAARPPPRISNLADPLNLTIDVTTGEAIGPLSPTAPIRLKKKRLSKKRLLKLEIDFESDQEVEGDHAALESIPEEVRKDNSVDGQGASSCKNGGVSGASASKRVKMETFNQSNPSLTVSSDKSSKCPNRHRSHRPRHKPSKQPPKAHQTKPRGASFIHGNYTRYYGYRSCDKMEVDPRVKSLKPSWFVNKSVLDIGCNIGHVTLTIARDYNPSRVVGMDIDNKLIAIARKNVKHYKQEVDYKFPASCRAVYGPIVTPAVISSPHTTVHSSGALSQPITTETATHSTISIAHPSEGRLTTSGGPSTGPLNAAVQCGTSHIPRLLTTPVTQPGVSDAPTSLVSQPIGEQKLSDIVGADEKPSAQPTVGDVSTVTPSHFKYGFPQNISFICSNYCLESDSLLEMVKAEFDIILALSVTKWIHLNNGDEGLKRSFKRMYLQLNPGGILILEPQMWPSYKKRKSLTEKIRENFDKILLRPDQFNEYLLSSEVGFVTCERLNVQDHQSKGFRRPVFVFHKSTT